MYKYDHQSRMQSLSCKSPIALFKSATLVFMLSKYGNRNQGNESTVNNLYGRRSLKVPLSCVATSPVYWYYIATVNIHRFAARHQVVQTHLTALRPVQESGEVDTQPHRPCAGPQLLGNKPASAVVDQRWTK